MYAKIFERFFDSSINEEDPVTRLLFIAMIILSDSSGVLNVTRQALARRVNLSPEQVDQSLAILSAPDPESNSREFDGRRIVALQEGRSWGWLIVNKELYRGMVDPREEREKTRERVRRFRERKKKVTGVTLGNVGNDNVSVSALGSQEGGSRGKGLSRKECDTLFEELWKSVPKKQGKRDALKTFHANIKTPGDVDRYRRGIDAYLKNIRRDGTENRYIQKGSTLFNAIAGGDDFGQPVGATQPAPGTGDQLTDSQREYMQVAHPGKVGHV